MLSLEAVLGEEIPERKKQISALLDKAAGHISELTNYGTGQNWAILSGGVSVRLKNLADAPSHIRRQQAALIHRVASKLNSPTKFDMEHQIIEREINALSDFISDVESAKEQRGLGVTYDSSFEAPEGTFVASFIRAVPQMRKVVPEASALLGRFVSKFDMEGSRLASYLGVSQPRWNGAEMGRSGVAKTGQELVMAADYLPKIDDETLEDFTQNIGPKIHRITKDKFLGQVWVVEELTDAIRNIVQAQGSGANHVLYAIDTKTGEFVLNTRLSKARDLRGLFDLELTGLLDGRTLVGTYLEIVQDRLKRHSPDFIMGSQYLGQGGAVGRPNPKLITYKNGALAINVIDTSSDTVLSLKNLRRWQTIKGRAANEYTLDVFLTPARIPVETEAVLNNSEGNNLVAAATVNFNHKNRNTAYIIHGNQRNPLINQIAMLLKEGTPQTWFAVIGTPVHNGTTYGYSIDDLTQKTGLSQEKVIDALNRSMPHYSINRSGGEVFLWEPKGRAIDKGEFSFKR